MFTVLYILSRRVPSLTRTLTALNLTSEQVSPTSGSNRDRTPASRAHFLPSVVTTTLHGRGGGGEGEGEGRGGEGRGWREWGGSGEAI